MLHTDLPRSKTTSILWTTSIQQLERYCFTSAHSCRTLRIVKVTLFCTKLILELKLWWLLNIHSTKKKKNCKHGIIFSQLVQLTIHHFDASSDYTESSGGNNLILSTSCSDQWTPNLVQDLVMEKGWIFARGRSILPIRHIKTQLFHNYPNNSRKLNM